MRQWTKQGTASRNTRKREAAISYVSPSPSTHTCENPPLETLHPAFSAQPFRSPAQYAALVAFIIIAGIFIWLSPLTLIQISYWFIWLAFLGNALLRLAACVVPRMRYDTQTRASNENLPSYSVIVALYKEAAIVPQLLEALQALHYPRDRLEILIALEADDPETLETFHAHLLPQHIHIVVVPEGTPKTKPRALNYALALAKGDLVVIYDAEDRPHPDQLLQAAAGFNAGPANLACLQAPLRPVGGKGFIGRQFTLEYAVQFDVLLPALNALRLPFPLGGTSNHFKSDILKTVGGWDAYNVTEDADLGIRLAQYGYRLGLIDAPTFETPPATTQTWLPQRTRWIKGYLQTLLVHTRLVKGLKPRAWLSLFLSVALSVMAAICYAPFTALLTTSLLLIGMQSIADTAYTAPTLPLRDIVLFAIGMISAMGAQWQGARRAGVPVKLSDFLSAPAYWSLQSAAACFAIHQLITRPFHWDKTEHAPDPEHKPLYVGADGDYGQGHDHKRHRHNSAHQALG